MIYYAEEEALLDVCTVHFVEFYCVQQRHNIC